MDGLRGDRHGIGYQKQVRRPACAVSACRSDIVGFAGDRHSVTHRSGSRNCAVRSQGAGHLSPAACTPGPPPQMRRQQREFARDSHSLGSGELRTPTMHVTGIPCWCNRLAREGRYNLDPDIKFFATPPHHGSLAEVRQSKLCRAHVYA